MLVAKRRAWAAAAALFACACLLGACGSSAPTTVAAFPIPGSHVAAPQSQIAFRGVAAAHIGTVEVTGSQTGAHAGRIEADSDGHGGSFLPDKPFAAGEVVTVRTGLPVTGAAKGTFRFTVATPAGAIAKGSVAPVARVPGDVEQFHSRPDLQAPTVEVLNPADQGQAGDVFIAPQAGPFRVGPMIVNPDGTLVWFHPVPAGDQATDFRPQQYRGAPALTWWQGYFSNGVGVGEDVIYDSSYRQVAIVRAANGLSADLHEFQLTPAGTALITAYYPVYANTSSVRGGATRAAVLDSVVQEIDVKTGLVLFQWDSLDHVPVSASELALPTSANQPYDYFHVNSVQEDADGSLVISARNTWAAYKVSHDSGQIIWTLGGKNSSFKVTSSAAFAFQHDVRIRSGDDTSATLFDDGAGPPNIHTESRGIRLKLDRARKTATLNGQFVHAPPLLAPFEGNVQTLANGDVFIGWGGQPYFSEFDGAGHLVFDGRFVDANTSYRAYRFVWSGTPKTQPKLAVAAGSGADTAYASWNGATDVASWRVLGGRSASAVSSVTNAPKAGFETQVNVPAQPYMAVQALNSAGHVVGTSATVRAP